MKVNPDFEVIKSELALYRSTCPNCGGLISDYRLSNKLPCYKCIPEEVKVLDINEVVDILKKRNTLRELLDNYVIANFLKEFSKVFEKTVGSKPWNIQVLWAKRLALNTSFAMIAPTGVGKSTFGIVAAIYYAIKGLKTYIIVPTTTLALQYEKKLKEFIEKVGVIIPYCVIHSKLRIKERKEREEMIKRRTFDILITTSRWLLNNYEHLKGTKFKLIFIDDVDAVMRGSKVINYILYLAGFTDHDIENAYKLMKLKRELASSKEKSKHLEEEYERLSKYLIERRSKVKTIIIISSATGRPRGTRVKLFKELLGFEIGARTEVLRNVVDSFLHIKSEKEVIEKVIELVRTLGKGGLVYVPVDKGIEYAEELAKYLMEKGGLKAKAMHSKNVNVLNEFIEGNIDVLVGVATYYGVLVRGIDLPEIIRYAIFIGVPRHKISLTLTELKPTDIILLLSIIRDLVSKEEAINVDLKLARVRRLIRRVGASALKNVEEVLLGKRKPKTVIESLFIELQAIIKSYLEKKEILEKLKQHSKVALVKSNEKLYLLIPDAMTYIQASGRTSRLYVGGITKGLSIILVDDVRLINGLADKLKWIIDDFKLINFNELNLKDILSEIDRDRKNVSLIRAGFIKRAEAPIQVTTSLLIVESPNKARTIARFFGKPSSREIFGIKVYEVSLGNHTLLITSSGGHLFELIEDEERVRRDLSKYGIFSHEGTCLTKFVPVYGPVKRCLDCGHQFTERLDKCPICGSKRIKNNEEVIKALRRIALEVDEILIGTDPDAEGEKIAYDIAIALGLHAKNIKRIEFHEVTRKSILKAIRNPRTINYDLVKAQIVRRIEDRWIGFTLSPKLWHELWPEYCKKVINTPSRYELKPYIKLCRDVKVNKNLSAGRVQTPVLGWVIDNYEEYKKGLSYYMLINIDGQAIEVNLGMDLRPEDIELIEVWIKPKEINEVTLNPLPPYTTDTALSEISSRLRIKPSDIMGILQDLFEMGFITYHRTDSVRVSDVGINIAKEYLIGRYGDLGKEIFRPRSWGVGGAHECIRPTRPADTGTLLKLINEGVIEPVKRLTKSHFIAYDMIFKRFIASQMKPAKLLKQKAEITAIVRFRDKKSKKYEISIDRYVEVIDRGFLEIYPIVKILSKLNEGVLIYDLSKDKNKVRIRKKSSVPLYTESDLVRLMKERGIGRPSTYAKIIDVLHKRKYVLRRRDLTLIPTELGKEVHMYLTRKYGALVSENRTRLLEEIMDKIEGGVLDYLSILNILNEELKKYNLM